MYRSIKFNNDLHFPFQQLFDGFHSMNNHLLLEVPANNLHKKTYSMAASFYNAHLNSDWATFSTNSGVSCPSL